MSTLLRLNGFLNSTYDPTWYVHCNLTHTLKTICVCYLHFSFIYFNSAKMDHSRAISNIHVVQENRLLLVYIWFFTLLNPIQLTVIEKTYTLFPASCYLIPSHLWLRLSPDISYKHKQFSSESIPISYPHSIFFIRLFLTFTTSHVCISSLIIYNLYFTS